MTTIDLTKHHPTPEPEPEKPRTVLHAVTAGREPALPLDTTEPIRPEWLRTWDGFRSTAALSLRRGTYRTTRFLLHLPVLLALLVLYSPRGLGRLAAVLGRYLYDYDSATVRHTHAASTETKEYVAANNVRKANLRARWMVAGTLLVLVLVPVLAWTAPAILAVILGAAVFIWTVKLIPGREFWEFGVAAGLAVGAWWVTPQLAARIPAPPVWSVLLVALGVVLALGWLGRPAGRQLVKRTDPRDAGILEKPTAPMVVDALVRLSIPGLTEKTRDDIRVFAPGVARSRRGYHLAMEVPAGVTAAAVMDKREEFAGALRRELGTVWPSKGTRHPGHLELFIADEPMATAQQPRWPIADGTPVDIFEPLPLFTDQEGRWVDLTLAYNHLVIGGAPGYGKSFAVREVGVAVAFDPRTRITCLDGKGNGDLRPLRLVAHGFYEGDEPDEIAEQLAAVRAIREEMRRRARFLRDLPRDENPMSKVTSALVDRYPHLAPIVLLIDEVQVYTEHEDKEVSKAFIALFTDLVKRGRSAAIIPAFCTQKPDASALPSAIADNCTLRLCFRVHGQRSNDQVLGTEMHRNGVKATLFSAADKGLAWLRGDGGDPLVVRTVYGLDAVEAEELMVKARAIREGRGLLTGQAAGEDAHEEALQVDLLADVREVMDEATADRMHLSAVLGALALLRPLLYGPMEVEGLGSALRAAGVPTLQVKVGSVNRQGVRRGALDVAATSDEDPDEGGVVVPIR
ncbi:MAG: hypothetical protein L0I24_00300 [Pseudonocardia sp.]|nr:hypothetical protein [Pseudonocardia sp.]